MRGVLRIAVLLLLCVVVWGVEDSRGRHRGGRRHHRHHAALAEEGERDREGSRGDHRSPRIHHARRRIPDWMAPWMKGRINLGPAVSVDWDMERFFEKSEWWKGPNVCESREESEETETPGGDQGISRHHMYNRMTCDETDTSYTCTTIVGFGGKRKTFKVTYECCHGYQREVGQAGCPQALDLHDLVETVHQLGAAAFARALTSVGIGDLLGEGNYTIFAPTDEKFKSITPQQEVDNNVVIVTPEMRTMAEQTRELVMGHVAPGSLKTSKLQDEHLIKTVNPRAEIRINFYDTPKRLVTANCMPVISTDNPALGGVVHLVDGVLTPVQLSLAEIVAKDPELATLKTMLGRIGLSQTLRQKGQYTLFAPTNAAFKKLRENTLDKLLGGDSCLNNLLRNHLLPNVVCSSIIEGRVRTPNVLDTFLKLNRTEADKLYVEDAQIVVRDIMGTNGVLHLIDTVMVPDDALDVLDVAEKAGATEFVNMVEKAGMGKLVQNMANFTLFLPTNKAMQRLPASVKADLQKDSDMINKLIKYHMATSLQGAHSLRNNMDLSTLDSDKKIRISEYQSAPFGMKQVLTAQCAPIIGRDFGSCNGVTHLVDQVLIPPAGDILDVLSQNANFSTLVELMKIADFSEDMQQTGPYTFYAPTNQAFTDLDSGILEDLKKSPDRLKSLLQYHVMRGVLCCAGVFDSHFFWKQRERSLDGSFIRLGRYYNDVVIDRDTRVTRCDMTATNGVVHGIEQVLPKAVSLYGRQEERRERRPGIHKLSRFWERLDEEWEDVWENMKDWDWDTLDLERRVRNLGGWK